MNANDGAAPLGNLDVIKITETESGINTSKNVIKRGLSKKNTDKGHLLITDLAMHFDELDTIEPSNTGNLDVWVLLTILSMIVPFVSCAYMKMADSYLTIFVDLIKKGEIEYLFLCIGIGSLFSLLACLITHIFKDAEGSGIPELKSILSGIGIYKYLSFKNMLAKIFGLFCATASCLFLGREGPFVHISASIAHNLSKIRFFKRLHEKDTFRKQILSTAGGIGLAATFGSPIGGVFYSMETMSTFFAVSTIMKGFFCATICFVFYNFYIAKFHIAKVHKINFEFYTDTFQLESLAFIALGLICGIISVGLVKLIEFLVIERKKIKSLFIRHYLYALTISVCSVLIGFYFSTFGIEAEEGINSLLQASNVGMLPNWELFLLSIIKLFLLAFSVSCPVPSGVFIPSYLIGAMIGRVFGNICGYNAGAFALVGAASLVSGFTHTLAIIIITVELTGQMALLIPLLLGVLSAYIFSKKFGHSYYHVIVEIKNLPFLPRLLDKEFYAKTCGEIADRNFSYLTLESTFLDGLNILSEIEYRGMTIPILDKESTGGLIFTVQSANLRDYLKKESRKYVHDKTGIIRSMVRSSIKHRPFIMESIPHRFQEYLPDDLKELRDLPPNDPIYMRNLDFSSSILAPDGSPFTVLNTVQAGKVHLLFSMMGLHTVFVLKKGKLIGVISIETFQKKNVTKSLAQNEISFIPID